MSNRAFTLVELLVVVAILAILAGVALSQYSAYKNRARAKDLISLAGACIHEILAYCTTDADFSSPQDLENCRSRNATRWLETVSFNATPPFSSFSCNQTFTVTASARLKGTGLTYAVSCTYDVQEKAISCTGAQKVP
ncbi:type II secretion system protein [Thermosulfurimonas marina]|uniref:Type II secretion system protein n=1 Tax=Thermosulfurimonas marina TaxID=2047767 RepID=A0A6H1WTN8_9BACT|nr:type II secretion system protein [Thermosulfurimonas marina]QJA06514.1 type II secretion system protein [Thermosulfurimonas marina]